MLPRAEIRHEAMSGRGTSKTGTPGPSEPRPTPDDDLQTSEDLFGSLVDSPLPPGEAGRAPRKGPIRVQVSDPVTPEPFAAVAEDLPSTPAAGPGAEAPAPSDAKDEVDDAFSRLGGHVPESIFRPAGPVTDDEEARLPPAAVRTGAKLSITDARVPAGPGLDLASVAESAIEEKAGEPEAEPPKPALGPAREPSWRDDRFGPYELLDRVAIGGMAEVFKAKKAGVEGFEKVVALKRILPHLSENKEFLDMFVDEAKMVAGLTHPNIVQIFELDRIEKSYYIAMEYVHGRDLRTIMKRAREKGLRMPLDISLRVASQVCAALEYAHRKKDERGRPMEIVHRDVSPQNILISFEGEVKLVDFGIAKAATKASNTDRGALRGKLLYMSPEQAWGRTIDRRSDVFSLGIVLYEMVTETKPFIGAGTELTILELVRQCVITPPRELNPRVPEALDRVIMKALARDPGERYEDAGQMQRGLERFLRERPPVTARDLARFLELLFDRAERNEGSADGRQGEHPGHTPDPLSLDSLLKRFGIDE
jgi:serine/threonine protein kinase